MRHAAIGFLFSLILAVRLDAAFVVLANHTEKPVDFIVSPKGQGGIAQKLQPGEARAFPCGKEPFATVGGKSDAQMELEPYAAYVLVTIKGKIELKGIEFVGKPIPTTEVQDNVDPKPPLKIPVRVLMDDANPFARTVWEPKLKRRFAEAAEILKAASGIEFELAEIGEWKSDPTASSMENLVSDLEEKEKPKPGGIVIGYTSRKLTNTKAPVTMLGPKRGPLRTTILIREGAGGSGDQVELLTQELGHYLGGTRIPDPNSVMRADVGNGKANLAKFTIRFDPVNVLIMNLWAEDLASGKAKSMSTLRPETRARLARIYDTLAVSHPDTPLATAYKDLVAAERPAPGHGFDPHDPNPLKLTNPRTPDAEPTAVPTDLSNREKAIRRVVRGVTLRAVDNAKKPESGDDKKLTGDALTENLVRTAANIAAGEDESLQVAALAVGLGLALDDSTILRDNPLVRTMVRRIEPDADRKERIAALGGPTVKNRRDWCQHFAVSVALAELIGPRLAEQAGVAKEVADMQGTSGFSFADLTADFAGVEFYNLLKKDAANLDKIKDTFAVGDFVPDQTGVSDGLTKAEFELQFGSLSDDRYKKAVAEVRARIAKCKAYTK
jgi:hypothetical protein